MTSRTSREITAALVSRDPFFLFAARGLLGRDRRVRIFDTIPLLAELPQMNGFSRLQAVVCDLDAVEDPAAFRETLPELLEAAPQARVLCLAEGRLLQALDFVGDEPIHALLSKSDLGFCLHLAVHAVVETDTILLTPRSAALLPASSYLRRVGRTIGAEKPHPGLSERLAEVVMWRIFIGLDNPDIRDELLLGDDTVRGYVSAAYHALGASNELEAFDALSDWWWLTRFAQIVR